MVQYKFKVDPVLLTRMVQCSKQYKETGEISLKRKFEGALNFIIKENMGGIRKLQVQNAAVSSDFAWLGRENFNMITEEDYLDRGFELAFSSQPVAPGDLSWQIYTTETAIEWKKMEEGGRLDQQGFQGDLEKGFCEYHGAAIGWTDRLMRTSTPFALLNKIRALIVGYWVEKSDIHYQLLSAGATATGYTALQGAATESRVQRVIKTINSVANSIGRDNKDKGYGNTAAIPLVMYAAPEDDQIIEAAFRVITNAAISGAQSGEQVVTRRIIRHYSYNQFITQNEFIMCLPGKKLQRGDVMGPTVLTESKDIYTLNEGRAGWAIYGAVVADTDQIRGGNLTDA